MKLPRFNQKGIAHILAPVLFIVIFAAIGGYIVLKSNAAPVPKETKLADSTHIYYATGAIPPPDNVHTHTDPRAPSNSGYQTRKLPSSVDLTKWAPPVKNQGPVGSCTAWSIDYNLFGWYVIKYHHVGGMHSPMYTYAQIVNGRNTGTTFEDNLWIGLTKGIPAVKDVKYPYFNYHHKPTSKETKKAAKYKIKSYFNIFTGTQYGDTAELLLKYQLANRGPAVIAIPVYKEFDKANSKNSLVGLPADKNTLRGYHGLAVFGYNSKGLVIENSWGKAWGDKGFGTLSWDFVNQYAVESSAINGITVDKSL